MHSRSSSFSLSSGLLAWVDFVIESNCKTSLAIPGSEKVHRWVLSPCDSVPVAQKLLKTINPRWYIEICPAFAHWCTFANHLKRAAGGQRKPGMRRQEQHVARLVRNCLPGGRKRFIHQFASHRVHPTSISSQTSCCFVALMHKTIHKKAHTFLHITSSGYRFRDGYNGKIKAPLLKHTQWLYLQFNFVVPYLPVYQS